MTYRLATQNDVEAIKELCKADGLDMPTLQFCMVAEDNGKIIGYTNAMVVPIIDTVCNNPLSAKVLQDRMEGYLLANGYGIEMMFTKREDVEAVAKKYGYVKIKESMQVYAKEIK